jgi:hypothetical protein
MPPKVTIKLASSPKKKMFIYRVCPACPGEPDKGVVPQKPDKSVGRRSMSEGKQQQKVEPNRL